MVTGLCVASLSQCGLETPTVWVTEVYLSGQSHSGLSVKALGLRKAGCEVTHPSFGSLDFHGVRQTAELLLSKFFFFFCVF